MELPARTTDDSDATYLLVLCPPPPPPPQTNVEIDSMTGGPHEQRLSTLDQGVRGSEPHAVPGSSISLRVDRSRLSIVSFVDSSPFADRRRVCAHPP